MIGTKTRINLHLKIKPVEELDIHSEIETQLFNHPCRYSQSCDQIDFRLLGSRDRDSEKKHH